MVCCLAACLKYRYVYIEVNAFLCVQICVDPIVCVFALLGLHAEKPPCAVLVDKLQLMAFTTS